MDQPMHNPFSNEAFVHYWQMWNSTDLSEVRHHLELAVTDEFIFCDPLHFHTGRDALEENVRTFRSEWPNAQFVIASAVDNHHNRHRYRWNMINKSRTVVEGLDIATVDSSGLIDRIDGFFGELSAPPNGQLS